MALSIYTNLFSSVAQNNLNTANSSLSKSIERLSSGLRINSASDDASGLAVSEKLRGQIRGLAKASMNAQDAVSFLQTAEGGLEVIGSMLQRMRELAVQSGNGAYTSNDRKELQKEVDQLKEEVNRISGSTEFNTKKLLTGDAAALWSTSDPDNLQAIVRGAPAEGNYRLHIDSTGGLNNVYKSDIFAEKIIGGISDIGTTTLIKDSSYAKGNYAEGEKIKVGAGNVAVAASGVVAKEVFAGDATAAFTVDATASKTGYLKVKVNEDILDLTDASVGIGAFEVTFVDAKTGKETVLKGADALTYDGTSKLTVTGYGDITFTAATSGNNLTKGDAVMVNVQAELPAAAIPATAVFNAANSTIISDAPDALAAAAVNGAPKADGTLTVKILNDIADVTALTHTDVSVTFVDAKTGKETAITLTAADVAGGVITIADYAAITLTGTTQTAPAAVLGSGSVIAVDIAKEIPAPTEKDANITLANGLVVRVMEDDLKGFALTTNTMSDKGKVSEAQFSLALADSTAGEITLSHKNSQVAGLETKLKDINLFTNVDGRNLLDNTQEITIFGNGKTATIYMEGNDSIEDFVAKLNSAIVDGLGMTTGDHNIDSELVKYITTEEAGLSDKYAVPGTIVFQGGLVGDNSEISFMGDEGVLNALSIANIQKGQNADLNIQVENAHTGQLVGKDTVSDNVLRGVIEGIDVKINNPKLTAAMNTNTGEIKFTGGAGSTMDLHVVDNRTEVQVGANEGQTFDISLGQMNTAALEIDNAFVLTMDEAQGAITKFDQAFERVTSARATIGAQINRLEYTMENLAISRQNLTAAESRIRDLDVAEESAQFSRNQILVNSAIAMLAQANQLPQAALQLIGR